MGEGAASCSEGSLELHQLRSPRDQLQDRVLRRRAGWQDHQSAVIYQKTAEQQKGKMISLATETERTLFFDFLPWTWVRFAASRRASTSTPFPARSSTTPAAN